MKLEEETLTLLAGGEQPFQHNPFNGGGIGMNDKSFARQLKPALLHILQLVHILLLKGTIKVTVVLPYPGNPTSQPSIHQQKQGTDR